MALLKRILVSAPLLLACACPALTHTHAKAVSDATSVAVTTYRLYLPLVRRPECMMHTASMTLTATGTTLHVGELVTVTARLNNEGCTALGLPLYRLYWEDAGTPPVFEPVSSLEVVHYLSIAAGSYDETVFVLRAVGSGQATLRAETSFEVHLGYPGPAYWGASVSPPLAIVVSAQVSPSMLQVDHSPHQVPQCGVICSEPGLGQNLAEQWLWAGCGTIRIGSNGT